MSTAIADLIRTLVDNMDDAGDWSSLAMVLRFDSEKVNGVYGFAYSADGVVTPVTASPFRIKAAVKSYTDSYYKPGQPLPVKLLVQFDRVKGEYEVVFEDTDTSRWQVTPDTIAEVREELRPNFA